VRVGLGELPRGRFVTFWHQTYGEAEEEALLGGEAVDLRARLAGERLLETDGDR
jgi:hypothetical protein